MLLCRIVGYAPVTIKKWTVRFNLPFCFVLFGFLSRVSRNKGGWLAHTIHSIYRFDFRAFVDGERKNKNIIFLPIIFISLASRKKQYNRVISSKKITQNSHFSLMTKIHILLLRRPLRQPISHSYFRAECKGQIYSRNRFPICREK